MIFQLLNGDACFMIDTERGLYSSNPVTGVPTFVMKRKGDVKELIKLAKSSELRTEDEPVTTRREMQDLREGDVFYVYGEKHTATCDSHLCGDASCDEYVVYDENDEGWFETDFPRE